MISRNDLYALVWSQPMTKVATEFEVSGSYLARVCTLLNVPRPQRGYWAKLEAGKAPPQTPLPEAQPGDPISWSKDGELIPMPKPRAPSQRAREKKVRVARNQTHGMIRGAKQHFENSRRVDDGGYLKPYKKLLVDVTASQANLDKALGLANDLFNALDSVGHRVMLAAANTNLGCERIDEREAPGKPRDYWESSRLWSPYRPTVAYVGSVAIGIAIVEMSESVMVRYSNGQYVRVSDQAAAKTRSNSWHDWTTVRELPSGRMRVIIYSPYRSASWSTKWQETKEAPLRNQIPKIVDAIERAAPELVVKLEEAEREAEVRRQQRREEEQRRREEEDRKQIQKSIADSKTDLQQVIERWSRLMSIERFLGEVEQRAVALEEADQAEVQQRLALARDFLGSQDPLDFFRTWKTPDERYTPQFPPST